MKESIVDRIIKYVEPHSLLEMRDEIAKSCKNHEPIEGRTNIESILIGIKNGIEVPSGVKTQCYLCGCVYERPYNIKEKNRIEQTLDEIPEIFYRIS